MIASKLPSSKYVGDLQMGTTQVHRITELLFLPQRMSVELSILEEEEEEEEKKESKKEKNEKGKCAK